jgi:hypothetical protein
MDLIVDAIEWFAADGGSTAATLFPYALTGLAALYLAWVVLGYLRVSQVAIERDGPGPQPVSRLPQAADGGASVQRGVLYCPVDGLQYPPGARFCIQDESELMLSCANCGTTIRAADESCFRCGTRDTTARVSPEH